MSDPLPDADGEHSGPTSAAGTGGADEPRTPRGDPLPHTPRDAHSADGSLPSQPLHLRIMTIVFGLMFLATLAILGHLMWIAEPPPGMPLDRFFAAVESGRADKVLSLCDPRLRERIDRPVLRAWLDAVKRDLGALKTVAEKKEQAGEPAAAQPERHVMSGQALPQGKTRWVRGTAHFARGSVYAELCLENGRLTDIFIVSQGLSAQWLDTPEVLQLCRQRAERFLINRVPGEYLDPQAVNPQGFWADDRQAAASMRPEKVQQLGEVRSAVCKTAGSFTDRGDAVRLVYELDCEHGSAEAAVLFTLSGFRAELSNWSLKPPED